jgi:Domain of unknown function (DUF5615)
MKLKLDENLPLSLATLLKELGHDVETVPGEGLTGCADDELWRVAQKESRFLITYDMDFSDARKFAPGSHKGLLLVSLHTPHRRDLIGRMAEIFQKENVEGWGGCVVMATDRKIRILREKS